MCSSDLRYDLPVFGADIVASRAGVSAAIADLSPVGPALPAGIDAALTAHGRPAFAEARALPDWGAIFSPHVLFVRPADGREEQLFIAEVERLLAVLAAAVRQCEPQAADDPATVARWEGQVHYCQQQKRNDKTRRVLEKAFSPSWADRYIEALLFDDPPHPSCPG